MQSEFEAFRELVLTSAALQRRLMDETDWHAFVTLVVEVGSAHGHEFSGDVVRSVMSENQKSWLASRAL